MKIDKIDGEAFRNSGYGTFFRNKNGTWLRTRFEMSICSEFQKLLEASHQALLKSSDENKAEQNKTDEKETL